MLMKSILFLAYLSTLQSFSSGQTCDAPGEIRIDQTYAKLLVLGGSGRKFPEDKNAQLKKFCSQSYEWLTEIDEYKNKCLKQMPKQVTGVVVYSVRNTLNQYCKKDSKKLTELISSTPCANAAKKVVDQCYTTLIDKFQGAIYAEEKMRIPYTCCEYFKFLDCFKEQGLKNKNCNEKQLDVVTNWVREIFGNLVDFICGDYTENSDKCDKMGPTPKKKKGEKRTKSFMIPLIKSIASLPDV